MAGQQAPVPVQHALRRLGRDVASWRRLRRLTVAQVADRAGVGESTVSRVEGGQGASLENMLRIARALGVLDLIAASLDPYATEVGQLRAEESLPRRVRPRREPA